MFNKDIVVLSSYGKDIKIILDQTVNVYICNNLSKTGIPIVSEESDNDSFDINRHQWIIDPIDGTMNFSKGFEMAAVSIALWNKGVPILGVIHHLFSNQVFFSSLNQGAWLNEKMISISNVKNNNEAVLATGFPSGRNFSKDSLNQFVKNVQVHKKIRMLGSASLMLAFVSCGYFDIYQEDDIYIWDVAAGLALISEAGGVYAIEPGSSEFKFNVRATNKNLI